MAGAEDSATDIAEKNRKLLEEIVQLCQREDRKKSEVILLIGKSGAGKSAFINTVHKVLTGHYYQIARQGAGHAQSVTLELQRYDHLGLSLESVIDEERRQLLSGVLDKLPRILDFAGLGDENTEELAEILELAIGGFIPERTLIKAVEERQKQTGVGSLKRLFKTSDPDQVVTKVVFVQGCTDGIPQNLIACLQKVLTTINPTTMTRKYDPEIFLLITKYDLVRDPSKQLHINHGEKKEQSEKISLEEFEKNENEIAPFFNIVGALEKNRIRWVSFTDAIEEDNPHIDNIALKFVKRMVEPDSRGGEDRPPPKQVIGFRENVELWLVGLCNKLKDEWHFQLAPAHVLICFLLAAVLALFYKLLSTNV